VLLEQINYQLTTANFEKEIKNSTYSIILVISPLLMMAQQPPHPNCGANPDAGNGPVGTGAPIYNGLNALLLAAIAYTEHTGFIARTLRFQ
jgi:hypothetical protein